MTVTCGKIFRGDLGLSRVHQNIVNSWETGAQAKSEMKTWKGVPCTPFLKLLENRFGAEFSPEAFKAWIEGARS